MLQAASSVGNTCPGSRCVLFIVGLDNDVSRLWSCVDFPIVRALLLRVFGVNYSAGSTLCSLRVGVARWIENKYSISSPPNVIECDVFSIIRNGAMDFANSSNYESSSVCSNAAWGICDRST